MGSEGAQKQTEVNASNTGPTLYNIPPNSLNHVVAQHLNLREAIVKYENIVEHLERLWESKVRGKWVATTKSGLPQN